MTTETPRTDESFPHLIGKTPMENLIRSLSEAVALDPAGDWKPSDDLFRQDNKRTVLISFFTHLISSYKENPLIKERVDCFSEELLGSPIDVYLAINSPGHPVRDGLIMLSAGVLLETDNSSLKDKVSQYKERVLSHG